MACATSVVLAVLLGCARHTAATSNPPVEAPASTRRTMIPYKEVADAPAPPADHIETYGDGPLQFGELRLPHGTTRAPIVIFIHGGCWLSAYTLDHTRAAAAAIADAGYAVWTPEYRRVGDQGGGFPGTFNDIRDAIRLIPTLAEKYRALDASRVVLVGHSAGAQLALSAAGLVPTGTLKGMRIVGVVSLAGITDIAAYASPTGCGAAVASLMGSPPSDSADRWRIFDPIRRLPMGIPVRLVHGVDDPIVPIAQSRAYAERARAAGVSLELVEIPGGGHFDVVATHSTAWPAVLDAIRALAPLPAR
jgi:acetyl esterase/lipase